MRDTTQCCQRLQEFLFLLLLLLDQPSLCVYLCLLMAIFRTEANFFSAAVFWGFGLGLATCGDNLLCAVEIRKNKQGPIISFLCSLLAMDMSDQLTIGQSHLAWKCSKNQKLAKIFTLTIEFMKTTEVGIRRRNFLIDHSVQVLYVLG